jgi:hypothetical protein
MHGAPGTSVTTQEVMTYVRKELSVVFPVVVLVLVIYPERRYSYPDVDMLASSGSAMSVYQVSQNNDNNISFNMSKGNAF